MQQVAEELGLLKEALIQTAQKTANQEGIFSCCK
jgi:hypothetical protein